MDDKQVKFRLSAEEYEKLSVLANSVDMSVASYAKAKILNTLDSSPLENDKLNVLMSELVELSLDSNSEVNSVRLMLKIVMQQTWTLLQAVSLSSDESGRKELKKLYEVSQERVEKIIKKIGAEKG